MSKLLQLKVWRFSRQGVVNKHIACQTLYSEIIFHTLKYNKHFRFMFDMLDSQQMWLRWHRLTAYSLVLGNSSCSKVPYLEILQAQEGLDEQQASCTAIRRGRNVKQLVCVEQRQEKVDDTIMFTIVCQPIHLIEWLALLKRCQLLPHASYKTRAHKTHVQFTYDFQLPTYDLTTDITAITDKYRWPPINDVTADMTSNIDTWHTSSPLIPHLLTHVFNWWHRFNHWRMNRVLEGT